MLTQNKIKLLKQLQNKKYREETGTILIEGEKIIKDCLSSDWEVTEGFFTDQSMHEYTALFKMFNDRDIPCSKVKSADFIKFSTDINPAGIAALVRKKTFNPEELLLCEDKRFLILENLNDPGNLGTIIRTACWFGIKNIFLNKTSVEITNPKVIKGSMGAVFKIRYCENCDMSEIISELKSGNTTIYAADLDGKDIRGMGIKNNFGIVFGGEANGITEATKKMADEIVTIKGYGDIESLNVAISAGIILFSFTSGN